MAIQLIHIGMTEFPTVTFQPKTTRPMCKSVMSEKKTPLTIENVLCLIKPPGRRRRIWSRGLRLRPPEGNGGRASAGGHHVLLLLFGEVGGNSAP